MPVPTATPEAWSPERISADPQGYLLHAQSQVGEQIRLREQKLQQLGQRRADVEARAGELLRALDETGNLRRRLAVAIQRAEDEDRWPLQFAGRSLSREQARAVDSAAAAFIEQRRGLADAYRDALRRLDQLERTVRQDILNLQQMRERVAPDLERVRLNQGLAELSQLRQTEATLANFSANVSALTDDPLAGLALDAQGPVSLDELFKTP